MTVKNILITKRLCGLICALFVGLAGMVLAGAKDLVFTCSTRGVDVYADGTPVADGECYALVYTEKGTTFQGFTADGRAQNPTNSYVALAASLAEGGRCPPTLFQVLEANAAVRTNGVWELFLLDTRAADGKPAGMDAEGRLRRVNAWSRVAGRIRAKRGSLTSTGAFEEVAADTSARRLEGGAGAIPADAPKPRITGIRVVDGTVKLTVADTVPYLTYDVDGAAAPHDFGRRSRRVARRPQDGRAGKAIEMEVPVEKGAGDVRFFKVVRK